jgi:hypothetical protein
MRSSTSAFDVTTPSRAIVLLLAAVALYFLVLEGFAREVLPRISQNQRRIAQDYTAALQLRPTLTSGARSILVVGNSLLLHGIDRDSIRALMGPDYEVVLYPIEGTTYLDWAYGLRRLFAEGSRPRVVVLCISTRHLLSDATDGEGFAHALMQLRDLPPVVRDAHLNMMTASAYFFANASAWLGTRTTFRDGLLEKWLPGADMLALHLSARDPVPLVATAGSVTRGVQRLQALRTLTAEYHAGFIYLVPPTLYKLDIAPAVAAAARPSGVSVLIPFKPGEMPQAAFSDGFHLNEEGARSYTARAATALVGALAAGPAGGAAGAADGDLLPLGSEKQQ